MEIIVNGDRLDVTESSSLEALLTRVGKSSEHVAVERNGEVVEAADIPNLRLQPGDVLEVVHFVGGG
jgi:thiamine biosynthesis protein ThiS